MERLWCLQYNKMGTIFLIRLKYDLVMGSYGIATYWYGKNMCPLWLVYGEHMTKIRDITTKIRQIYVGV